MKSIKAKFTLALTLTLFGVLMVFAAVVYSVNVNVDGPITPTVLNDIGRKNPRAGDLLEKINQNQMISEVYGLVREDQVDKYKTIYLILIPPTLLLSALIAYAVSSYLLKPIEDLAIQLRQIGSTNISKRLQPTSTSTEIELLINTFNNLLEELEEAFNIQDQFIQDAAHELRTPISAIKTNIQVFRESNAQSKQDYEKLVEIVERINNKLIKLNENLLFLNKQSKNKSSFEDTKLYGIIEDVMDTVSILAKKKDISIEVQCDDKISAAIDPSRFSIAIKNLLENAIKYSENNTKIKVNCSENSKEVFIAIDDEGIGIKNADITRIFDRFYRSENTNPNMEEGEGLGLSIVKKIVNEHNASIKVEQKKDKGSIFTITIPKKK